VTECSAYHNSPSNLKKHVKNASAAAERLFSCAGLTMTNRRTNMTDELLEDLT